jgi:hypothetical protein
MKYRIYLEDEYEDDLEPDREIECEPDWLDIELKDYCEYLYNERDGWEWMKNSDERILAIDESGNKLYYHFEVDFKPVFYISESKD